MAKDHNVKVKTDAKCLSKVLKVMNEVWQLSTLVYFFARCHNALCQRSWSAAEYSNLAYLSYYYYYYKISSPSPLLENQA